MVSGADATIQTQIDKEQERIDKAFERIQPAIDLRTKLYKMRDQVMIPLQNPMKHN